jgi:hypothetical protein
VAGSLVLCCTSRTGGGQAFRTVRKNKGKPQHSARDLLVRGTSVPGDGGWRIRKDKRSLSLSPVLVEPLGPGAGTGNRGLGHCHQSSLPTLRAVGETAGEPVSLSSKSTYPEVPRSARWDVDFERAGETISNSHTCRGFFASQPKYFSPSPSSFFVLGLRGVHGGERNDYKNPTTGPRRGRCTQSL